MATPYWQRIAHVPTLRKVCEQTSQNLLSSAPHWRQAAGSPAWCPCESLSLSGNSWGRQPAPWCTKKIQGWGWGETSHLQISILSTCHMNQLAPKTCQKIKMPLGSFKMSFKSNKLPYCGTPFFREVSAALQLTVQLSLGCKFKDEVYTGWVMEVTIEAEDVGVPERNHCRWARH